MRRRTNIAQVLLAGAGLDTAIRCWHLHHMDALRQQYQANHGPIDIPEAMYFDGLAVMVQNHAPLGPTTIFVNRLPRVPLRYTLGYRITPLRG